MLKSLTPLIKWSLVKTLSIARPLDVIVSSQQRQAFCRGNKMSLQLVVWQECDDAVEIHPVHAQSMHRSTSASSTRPDPTQIWDWPKGVYYWRLLPWKVKNACRPSAWSPVDRHTNHYRDAALWRLYRWLALQSPRPLPSLRSSRRITTRSNRTKRSPVLPVLDLSAIPLSNRDVPDLGSGILDSWDSASR